MTNANCHHEPAWSREKSETSIAIIMASTLFASPLLLLRAISNPDLLLALVLNKILPIRRGLSQSLPAFLDTQCLGKTILLSRFMVQFRRDSDIKGVTRTAPGSAGTMQNSKPVQWMMQMSINCFGLTTSLFKERSRYGAPIVDKPGQFMAP